MITVAVANQKGGVGKTTTAVTLAHGLALKGFEVLLVDLDPQGQCASHLGMGRVDAVAGWLLGVPEVGLFYETGREGLTLLPGGKGTETAAGKMLVGGERVDVLAERLGELGGRFQYVILDTAPSAGFVQACALYACDWLVVPSAVDYLSLEGVQEVLRTLVAMGRGRQSVLRILPTFYDEVTRESAANLAQLRQSFGAMMWEPVHRAAVLRECPALGVTIFEHQAESRAAKEYARVVWGVVDGGGYG